MRKTFPALAPLPLRSPTCSAAVVRVTAARSTQVLVAVRRRIEKSTKENTKDSRDRRKGEDSSTARQWLGHSCTYTQMMASCGERVAVECFFAGTRRVEARYFHRRCEHRCEGRGSVAHLLLRSARTHAHTHGINHRFSGSPTRNRGIQTPTPYRACPHQLHARAHRLLHAVCGAEVRLFGLQRHQQPCTLQRPVVEQLPPPVAAAGVPAQFRHAGTRQQLLERLHVLQHSGTALEAGGSRRGRRGGQGRRGWRSGAPPLRCRGSSSYH